MSDLLEQRIHFVNLSQFDSNIIMILSSLNSWEGNVSSKCTNPILVRSDWILKLQTHMVVSVQYKYLEVSFLVDWLIGISTLDNNHYYIWTVVF